MNNADDAEFYVDLAVFCVRLGVEHSDKRIPALTAAALLKWLQGKFGQFAYRNGHVDAFRAAYGAGYKGPRLARFAQAQPTT